MWPSRPSQRVVQSLIPSSAGVTENMSKHWIVPALLSSALAVGCGDGGTQNQQNLEQSQAVAPAPGTGGEVSAPPEAAPPASPERDTAVAEPARTRPESAAPRQDRAPARQLSENRAPAASTAAPSVPRPRWREVTLPANTALPLEITTALSSETATVEMPVRARLRSAVSLEGDTVLPAGTVLIGQVIDVERPGRVQGRARLAVRFTEAEVNGEREVVRTNPITWEGEASKGEDATKIGAGAGIGAAIGGILGGGGGAAKGAAIGGAAGTGAVLATRGKDVEVASGSDVAATLATPATIRVEN